MGVARRRIYCVDTSSFVYCQRSFGQRSSRTSFYSAVWDLLDRLADQSRLQAPHWLFTEVIKNDDDIGKWAKAHRSTFRPKSEHATRVVEIPKEPGQRLVRGTAPRGSKEADPWVIAPAEAIGAARPTLFDSQIGVVVSEDVTPAGIADICARRRVEHLHFTGMLAAEGLSFEAAAGI